MTRHGGIWRRIGVFLAAYLLVAQAAIAGVAPHHAAPGMAGPAAWTLCVTDASGAPAAPDHAVDLSCCGVGCLVGAHLLASSDATDFALLTPVSAHLATSGDSEAAWPRAPGVRDRSPRGPPASA